MAACLKLAIGVISTALFSATISCGKRCESADGCVKTCDCTIEGEGLSFSCTMTFNCDPDALTCDPMHDKSCTEICKTYGAVGACGRQCESHEQCTKRCQCVTNSGATFLCKVPFACDSDVGVCETQHGLTSCDAVCANPILYGCH